ncbi:MAG: GFA family protein [Proteobacteria bacterium]|nr:GFA family protein [Pseudomonadota bacterium]
MGSFSGGCLCGEIRYEGSEAQGGGHCYCEDCRRSSGTSHCSHMIVSESKFSVQGEVRFFDAVADSGNTISRGFCRSCGSPIYSRNSGMPGMVIVRASSLDDPDVFTPGLIVYASRAPAWGQPRDDLPAFAEMPPASDIPNVEA